MQHSEFLNVAIEAAKAGEKVIRHYYQRNIEVMIKEDQTPVTVADVETEQAIKAVIKAAFPDHGFFGEETGRSDSDSEYTWLVDPIDGTKAFVRQYPMFSTQIALMKGDEIIVAVSNAPEFDQMAYAEKGKGAFLNDKPIRVSGIEVLNQAALSLGNVATLASKSEKWGNLGSLIQQVQRIRGYGDFLHYHMLASGKLDIVVESDVNILDIAALSLIVTEAGGLFTELDGGKIGLGTKSVLAAASQALYDKANNYIQY